MADYLAGAANPLAACDKGNRLVVIVTLRFQDTGISPDARDEIKTFERVTCLDVNEETGFLTVETEAGDFTFDPKIWHSFVVTAKQIPEP